MKTITYDETKYALLPITPTDVQLACTKAAINDMNDGVVVYVRHVEEAHKALMMCIPEIK
jgi:hypothetical protein